MKKSILLASAVLMSALALTGCSKKNNTKSAAAGKKLITVGYAQVGAESDWRLANTASFKSTFTEENGYKLIFDDAQQKTENQIKAMRSFIQQDVDYIVVAPNVETGWETVLTECKASGIPVILSDRLMKVSDDSLYLCWVGGNFLKEGRDGVKWLDAYLTKTGRANDKINIVDLQGTIGASAQIGRTQGIEEGVKAHSNWTMVAQQSGDFTQDGGQKVMEAILKSVGADNIDVVFAENDNMAWGAIDAIKAAGKVPGKDIIIICFDAVHETFNRMIAGEINCAVECNPLHGPRVAEIIQTLEKGGTVDKIMYVDEAVFDQENAAEMLPTRQY
ncbi:MAG: ABC transporter substrate-binding protein [Treponema sp.]|nr:ABC transporter substrate-binding protein [Spirochaetia bacterium]MDY2838938.1 ABC transporter substrate-binding protein [Treponema sp.]MDY5122988.1 ABC transporter substrate-binding protein [Treponema sp.]